MDLENVKMKNVSITLQKLDKKLITQKKKCHVCSLCDYKTNRKDNLRSHKMRVHKTVPKIEKEIEVFDTVCRFLIPSMSGFLSPTFFLDKEVGHPMGKLLQGKSIVQGEKTCGEKVHLLSQLFQLNGSKSEGILKDMCQFFDKREAVIQQSTVINHVDGLIGLGLFANKDLKAGSVLWSVTSRLCAIEDKVNNWTQKSLVLDGKEHLFLGPISFVAHNCSNQNAILRTFESTIVLELTKDVPFGGELFTSQDGTQSACMDCFLRDNLLTDILSLEGISVEGFDLGLFDLE